MLTRRQQRYRDLGIPSAYFAHAAHYERMFRNWGWDEQKIDEVLGWGATYNAEGKSEKEMFADFAGYVEKFEPDDNDAYAIANLAMDMRDDIVAGGVESLPPLPKEAPSFTSSDERRMEAIREQMRNDPDSARDKNLENEMLDLIEAKMAQPAGATLSNQPISANPDRIAEIRQLMRDDPHAYNSNPKLQAEHLGLIEAGLSADGASDGAGTDGMAGESAGGDFAASSAGEG